MLVSMCNVSLQILCVTSKKKIVSNENRVSIDGEHCVCVCDVMGYVVLSEKEPFSPSFRMV